MKDGLDSLVVQYYFELMLDLAEYLGADMDVAEEELMRVIELQTSLAKVSKIENFSIKLSKINV